MHVSSISRVTLRALVTISLVVFSLSIALEMVGSAARAAHGYGGGHHGHHHHGGYGHGAYGGGYGYGNWGYRSPGYGFGYGYSSTSIFGGGLTIGYGGVGYSNVGYSSFGYPGYSYYGGLGYPSYNYNVIGYPYGTGGVWGPYSNYGPLMLPSDQLYGPGALPAWSLPQALPAARNRVNPAVIQPAVNQPAAEEKPAAKVRVPSNDEAVKRAFKFLDFGDQLFGEQKFLEAYLRYQSAATAAPDLADTHFRRGFALMALNHYDRAAEAFRRGISLNPQWPKSPFRLDDIYQDNHVAKRAHLDKLAATLEKEPQNAQAMFLLGVLLYFDDQQERSRPFLQRALQLMKVAEENRAPHDPAVPNDKNPPDGRPAEGKGAQPPPARGEDLEI